MKKFVAVVLVITSLLVLMMGAFKVAEINKNRYYANAICEQKGGELHFYFDNQEFIWVLGEGDKIPGRNVVLVMESNGTDEYSDDEIINYRAR